MKPFNFRKAALLFALVFYQFSPSLAQELELFQKPSRAEKFEKRFKKRLQNRTEIGRNKTNKRLRFKVENTAQDMDEVEIFTAQFQAIDQNGRPIRYRKGRHFRNGGKRFGAISITDDNQVIGRMDTLSVYSDGYGRDSVTNLFFEPEMEPTLPAGTSIPGIPNLVTAPYQFAMSCKVTGVYLEVANDYFIACGSNEQTTIDAVSATFNGVAAIYAKEGVPLKISSIKIWKTADPYKSLTGSGQILLRFAETEGAKPFASTYHLGHYVDLSSGSRNNGGLAYTNGLNSPGGKYAYSCIFTNSGLNKNYSWSIGCMAHEIGHNFSSKHTHWCGWLHPDGTRKRIDSCFTPEAFNGVSCSGGQKYRVGTIMSYCHLSYLHGIDFSLGFGKLPGDQIRAGLAASNVPCTGPVPTPCTLWTYSTWSQCVNGQQTRTATADPAGCTGTPPLPLVQTCTVAPPPPPPPAPVEDGVIGPVMHYVQGINSFFRFQIPKTGNWLYKVEYCRFDGQGVPDSLTRPAACGVRNALNFSRPSAIQLSNGWINLQAITQPAERNKYYRVRVTYKNGSAAPEQIKQSAWFWW